MSNTDMFQQFVASMPARYAQTFSGLDIQQHASIVRARGQQLVHVDRFASMRHQGTALCIVAQDRPGLLATISAALTSADLSIMEAEIFTRRVSASMSEAVDLFWVIRRAPLQHVEIVPSDVRRVAHYLVQLLTHAATALPARSSSIMRGASAASARVRFIDDADGCFTTLEVEANDRSGLLLAICQTLFAAHLQIVGSHIKTQQGRVRGRFELIELDDQPIEPDRRQEIQLAILSALDELSRPTAAFASG